MQQTPTLESVRGSLDELREVARRLYSQYAGSAPEGWGLNEYLAAIDELERALRHAADLPPCSRQRFEAEKYARNATAQRLYYRGRLCLKTNRLGRFYKKIGEKGVDWAPTELSRKADRLAAEPLRQIYKATERCLNEL